MIVGTTRLDTYTVDINLADLEKVFITYSQQRFGAVVEKTGIEVTVVPEALTSKLICRLTQEDTLKFRANELVEIQVTVKMKNGDRLTSNIISDFAQRALKVEAI